eukprot:12435557-Alexandrium_andersonii.AAC.1
MVRPGNLAKQRQQMTRERREATGSRRRLCRIAPAGWSDSAGNRLDSVAKRLVRAGNSTG